MPALKTSSEPAPPAEWTLRMKDLCDLSGLPRQAIHFYIQQGLLPAGLKTGRNMAFYCEEHVERLKLIKKLQHERFLPLKAIKALLDDQASAFSAEQRSFLVDVKQSLGHSLADANGEPQAAVRIEEAAERTGAKLADVARMIEIGVLGARDDDGATWIAESDLWMLQAWAEIDKLGYAKQLGIEVDSMQLLSEVVQELFNREAMLLVGRIEKLEPERAAEMIEKALPLVHTLLTGMHTQKIRNFFASLG